MNQYLRTPKVPSKRRRYTYAGELRGSVLHVAPGAFVVETNKEGVELRRKRDALKALLTGPGARLIAYPRDPAADAMCLLRVTKILHDEWKAQRYEVEGASFAGLVYLMAVKL